MGRLGEEGAAHVCCSIVMVTSQALTMRYGTTYTCAITTLTFEHLCGSSTAAAAHCPALSCGLGASAACGLAAEACTGEGRNPTDARRGTAD